MDDLVSQLLELRGAVLRYCRKRLRYDAEDVTQDVMAAVLAALPSYEDRGVPFTAYVFTIAKGKVANAYRATYRRPTTPIEDLPEHADPAPGPEELALRSELARGVGELLDRLPDRTRAVVTLRIGHRMTDAEVAAALDMSPGNVRVVQLRALQRLRTLAGAGL